MDPELEVALQLEQQRLKELLSDPWVDAQERRVRAALDQTPSAREAFDELLDLQDRRDWAQLDQTPSARETLDALVDAQVRRVRALFDKIPSAPEVLDALLEAQEHRVRAWPDSTACAREALDEHVGAQIDRVRGLLDDTPSAGKALDSLLERARWCSVWKARYDESRDRLDAGRQLYRQGKKAAALCLLDLPWGNRPKQIPDNALWTFMALTINDDDDDCRCPQRPGPCRTRWCPGTHAPWHGMGSTIVLSDEVDGMQMHGWDVEARLSPEAAIRRMAAEWSVTDDYLLERLRATGSALIREGCSIGILVHAIELIPKRQRSSTRTVRRRKS
jgi:hypothetical protein